MPVIGGLAGFSSLVAPGDLGVGVDATLTGPRGNAISGNQNYGDSASNLLLSTMRLMPTSRN